MTHYELTAALEALQSAGTISAGWVIRGTDYELAAGDSITPEQLNAAVVTWRATIGQRKIWTTVADFYAEFTGTEKYLIQSSTVPAILVARGDLAMWRGDVWSDNADVLAGLDAMVTAGVLTAERRAEILAK